ncbi:DUF4215 domain-containing protein [Nannocystis sp. ILAH1]|uniref:DUF4215 domain-containing protein n=1 Tax=unclassified Nannocystis TaxID=2627009 RepID=UPI0022712C09|nr:MULTISPECIES: DUF4215 domain-containing protein [unclassified Nannocystis]MCY0990937.1 DUF4215 domain-containing protein [Nannocystis sp. ILAH1]MCY1064440.1 DUF4215 domain-containing protein [Nannocystis sp. RBIL2]
MARHLPNILAISAAMFISLSCVNDPQECGATAALNAQGLCEMVVATMNWKPPTGDSETTGDVFVSTLPTNAEVTGTVTTDVMTTGAATDTNSTISPTDSTETSMTTPACGDGLVNGEDEECDDGNMMENDACLTTCKNATCGDGQIRTGVEECDAATNNIDPKSAEETDDCTTDCKIACGDGILSPSEECDDGNKDDEEGCSNNCIEPRLVFVTKSDFRPSMQDDFKGGRFKGVSGADAACGTAASEAQLSPTKWVAWISDGSSSPAIRMNSDMGFNGWYRLPDGTNVANGYMALTAEMLDNPIDVNEFGETLVVDDLLKAWTNTKPDGTVADLNDHCSGWTTNDDDDEAIAGDIKETGEKWTLGVPRDCTNGFHLYCFEVRP